MEADTLLSSIATSQEAEKDLKNASFGRERRRTALQTNMLRCPD